MPPPAYGATPQVLEEEHFPGRLAESAEAGYAQAQKVLERIAGDVEVEVRAAGIAPEVITLSDSPRAYRWLTATILYGAAAQYGMVASMQSVEVFDSWAEEYRRRMGRLRGDPSSVLDDVPSYGGGVSSYTAFV